MWKYASSLVCGIAIGVVIEKIIQYIKFNQKIKYYEYIITIITYIDYGSDFFE